MPLRGRRSVPSILLDWRSRFGFGWLEWVVLTGYIAVLVATIPHHEPWADEAQAWMIARDNSVWQILRYRLHYEGAPGLWPIILHVYQRLGGRYEAVDWMGAAFATSGIVVLLRWSPFPLLLRLLLPFTFFLQYQYAVIARGYTLFAALVFGLCSLFHSRRSPFWFALLAGLLANISLQGTVASFFLMLLYLFQDHFGPATQPSILPRRRSPLGPSALYLVLLGMAAFAAMPAPDGTFAVGDGSAKTGVVSSLLDRFPGRLQESEKLPVVSQAVQEAASQHIPVPPFRPADPPQPKPQLRNAPGAWLGWYLSHDDPDASGRPMPRSTSKSMLQVAVELLSLATGPISTFRSLACVFLLTLCLWLSRRNSLRMTLPWMINVLVGEVLWIADHHTGMLFILLLAAIWISAPSQRSGLDRPSPLFPRLTPHAADRLLMCLLVLVCASQIAWTVVAVRDDIHRSYDPGRETAAFLLGHPHERMAAFDFIAVDVQPYFDRNPFFNLSRGYWVWAAGANPNFDYAPTIEQHPDIVLLSQDLLASGLMHNDWVPLSPVTSMTQEDDLNYNPIVVDLRAHGYQETHRFCGDRFMRLSPSYRACDLIFEPVQLDAGSHQKSAARIRGTHRPKRSNAWKAPQ